MVRFGFFIGLHSPPIFLKTRESQKFRTNLFNARDDKAAPAFTKALISNRWAIHQSVLCRYANSIANQSRDATVQLLLIDY
jgi:hypothetical protein